MSIEETIEQRKNHEKQNENEMYDKAVFDRARLDNDLYLKKREMLKLRNLSNKQTTEGQTEIFNTPYNKMAREVQESRRKSKSMEKKPKSMEKKNISEGLKHGVEEVSSHILGSLGEPDLTTGKEPLTGQETLTNKEQNYRPLLNPQIRKNLLKESRKYRDNGGTKKKKRKKRKKPQTARGRRRRRTPTPRRRRRRASRKK